MVPPDKRFSQRTAQKRSGHKAEGSRCHGDGIRPFQAHLLQQRREASCRTVTAAHGNGAGGHAKETAHTQPLGNTYGNKVLTGNENRHQDNHNHQGPSSVFDHLYVGLETDRSEKEHHTDVLHRPFKGEFHPKHGVQQQEQQRNNETARHRSRNTEAFQETHLQGEKHSQQKSQYAHSGACIHIQTYHTSLFLPFKRISGLLHRSADDLL